eukprot:COSAG02_NODE_29261_length_573_cov_0.468354_1_plen_77_part_10
MTFILTGDGTEVFSPSASAPGAVRCQNETVVVPGYTLPENGTSMLHAAPLSPRRAGLAAVIFFKQKTAYGISECDWS